MSEACPGCGLVLAPVDTPTHAYNGELLPRVALHLTLERRLASEAEDVWAAWSEHHERARAWAG